MANCEELCRSIYLETGEFYKEIKPLLGEQALGFKILYGPPIINPPILFIGYQPGGGADDDRREQAHGSHERWPEIIEYATEDCTLAKRMRGMFDPEKLKGCAGLNAVFFRAPEVKAWRKIPRELRQRIERFCTPRVIRVVDAMQPALIVAIGFEVLSLFGSTKWEPGREFEGRVITRSGLIAGHPAIGTLHLSGAHISAGARCEIAERVGSLGWPTSHNRQVLRQTAKPLKPLRVS
jgi:hypothetical protein